MNVSRYDKRLQALAEKHEEYKQMLDPRAIRVLQQMQKHAEKKHDDILLGYVYHSLAFAHYFIMGDYSSFLKYLRKAGETLVAVQEEAELMHVYYLIAIDTLNRKMNDIAYEFFMMARNIAVKYGNTTSAAVLDENIGHVLLKLHAYREARIYSVKCLKELKKHPNHPHYYSNMMAGHLNKCAACLALGKIGQATKSYQEAKHFADKNKNHIPVLSWIELSLFGARVELANDRRNRIREELKYVHDRAAEMAQVMVFAETLDALCRELIEKGEFEEVQSLIRLMESHPPADDVLNMRSMLVNLKVDYYMAIGQTKQLYACYEEQDELMDKVREEQRHANRYASALISLIEDLRREQRRLLVEHDFFLKQAVTDTLTSLPNRYALNERMEEAFERAYMEANSFGIAILDVDNLKYYNDTHGHLEGDKCLRRIGDVLSIIQVQGQVFCSRYGGDEFVMVFENMTTAEIRTLIRNVRTDCAMGLSVGVCNAVPRKKSRIWDYFSCADKALYRAKENKGTNCASQYIRFERLQLINSGQNYS